MVVDGSTVLSQPWSGTLASYETTGVVLGSYDTSGLGAFELVIDEARTRMPRQQQLHRRADSELSGEKPTSPAVNLTTDAWGDETGWRIEDSQGNEIAGAPLVRILRLQPDLRDGGDLPAEGCYELILTDEYGDGMVGNWGSGPGSFALTTFEIPGNPFTDYNVFEYGGGFEFSDVLRQPFRAIEDQRRQAKPQTSQFWPTSSPTQSVTS